MKMLEEIYRDHSESYDGYCSRCDEITTDGGVEPDARGYPCVECAGRTVMGVEEALMMGKIEFVDPEGKVLLNS